MSAGAKRSATEAGHVDAAALKKRRSEARSALKTFLGDKLCSEEFMKNKFGREIVEAKNGAGFFGPEFATTGLDKLYELVKKFGEDGMDWGYTMEAVKTDDGKKVKLSPREGSIKLEDVKKYYEEEKATLQFHQPQHFCHHLARFMSRLEDLFGGCVGANVYLTPANAQGLTTGVSPAPHYDTVDVFVCQVSGKKTWKLHAGVVKDPLEDSGDLDTSEEKIGKLIKEITLEEGDFLYLPRGTVHYATTSSEPSAHITFSTNFEHYQGKFLQLALTNAIQKAEDKEATFRESLPAHLYEAFGSYPYHEKADPDRVERRKELEAKLKSLIDGLMKKPEEAGADSWLLRGADEAADSMCLNFLSERLPPPSLITEKSVLTEHKEGKDGKEKEGEDEEGPMDIDLSEDKMIEVVPGVTVRVMTPDSDSLPTLEDGLVSIGDAIGSDNESDAEDGDGKDKKAENGDAKEKKAAAEEETEEQKMKKRVAVLQDVVEEAEAAIEAAREATKNSLWIADNVENPVVGHMFDAGEDATSPLEFNKELKPVAMTLFSSAGPVSVGSLLKACPEGKDKEEVLAFLALLFAKRVIRGVEVAA